MKINSITKSNWRITNRKEHSYNYTCNLTRKVNGLTYKIKGNVYCNIKYDTFNPRMVITTPYKTFYLESKENNISNVIKDFNRKYKEIVKREIE